MVTHFRHAGGAALGDFMWISGGFRGEDRSSRVARCSTVPCQASPSVRQTRRSAPGRPPVMVEWRQRAASVAFACPRACRPGGRRDRQLCAGSACAHLKAGPGRMRSAATTMSPGCGPPRQVQGWKICRSAAPGHCIAGQRDAPHAFACRLMGLTGIAVRCLCGTIQGTEGARRAGFGGYAGRRPPGPLH